MEGDNVEVSTAGGTPASSRWNPTKEQISMLENLYKQGIRTPSAEQIQQITGRLKAYGHIEGKNVFYWFQNHKARQRQKQKQEGLAYLNRCFHKASSVFPPPPPCANVVCGPYYLPQSDLGFYPQYPKVLLPGGVMRRPRTDKVEKTKTCDGAGYETWHPGYNTTMQTAGTNDQETLPLFPVHPTGILHGRTGENSSHAPETDENSTTPSTSSETTGVEECSNDQPFFDFFSPAGVPVRVIECCYGARR